MSSGTADLAVHNHRMEAVIRDLPFVPGIIPLHLQFSGERLVEIPAIIVCGQGFPPRFAFLERLLSDSF